MNAAVDSPLTRKLSAFVDLLRQLRVAGLVTFRAGQVMFDDYDRLVDFAEFDKAYLDHTGPLLK